MSTDSPAVADLLLVATDFNHCRLLESTGNVPPAESRGVVLSFNESVADDGMIQTRSPPDQTPTFG